MSSKQNYRKYNEEVAQGITDFNDDVYIVMEEFEGFAIVLQTDWCEFLIVSGLEYKEYDSIDFDEDYKTTSDMREALSIYDKIVNPYKFSQYEVNDAFYRNEILGRDLKETLEYALSRFYTKLGIETGDITPEQSLMWDKVVAERNKEALRNLFIILAKQNEPKDDIFEIMGEEG